MPSAMILLADGSEETEFVTTYDVLVRGGIATKSCGVNLKSDYAVCTRNVKIVPDIKSIDDLPPEPNTDILILPGGAPGAKTFCEDDRVLRLIHTYRIAGKHTAFICAATTALVASTKWAARIEGLQIGKKVRVTSHPSVKKEIVDAGWQYAPDEERVVVDDKVITSRGPGTALLFGLTIVEELCGKAKRDEITGPLMCSKEL